MSSLASNCIAMATKFLNQWSLLLLALNYLDREISYSWSLIFRNVSWWLFLTPGWVLAVWYMPVELPWSGTGMSAAVFKPIWWKISKERNLLGHVSSFLKYSIINQSHFWFSLHSRPLFSFMFWTLFFSSKRMVCPNILLFCSELVLILGLSLSTCHCINLCLWIKLYSMSTASPSSSAISISSNISRKRQRQAQPSMKLIKEKREKEILSLQKQDLFLLQFY